MPSDAAVKHVPVQIRKDKARAFAARKRSRSLGRLTDLLWSLVFGRRRAPNPRLPRIELVWLPYYLFDIAYYTRKDNGIATISVEAHEGNFAIFQMHQDLHTSQVNGDVFPPLMTEKEAELHGRRELVRTILRRRGNRQKPMLGDTTGSDMFYYPYWVYYFERRGGRIDIVVVDAVDGQNAGVKHKAAVIKAFTAAERSKKAGGAAGTRANAT